MCDSVEHDLSPFFPAPISNRSGRLDLGHTFLFSATVGWQFDASGDVQSRGTKLIIIVDTHLQHHGPWLRLAAVCRLHRFCESWRFGSSIVDCTRTEQGCSELWHRTRWIQRMIRADQSSAKTAHGRFQFPGFFESARLPRRCFALMGRVEAGRHASHVQLVHTVCISTHAGNDAEQAVPSVSGSRLISRSQACGLHARACRPCPRHNVHVLNSCPVFAPSSGLVSEQVSMAACFLLCTAMRCSVAPAWQSSIPTALIWLACPSQSRSARPGHHTSENSE